MVPDVIGPVKFPNHCFGQSGMTRRPNAANASIAAAARHVGRYARIQTPMFGLIAPTADSDGARTPAASRQNEDHRIREFALIIRISRLYTTVARLLKNLK